jgi:hypothetical protein
MISASLLVSLVLVDHTLSAFERKENDMDGEHSFFQSVLKIDLLVGVELQCAAVVRSKVLLSPFALLRTRLITEAATRVLVHLSPA